MKLSKAIVRLKEANPPDRGMERRARNNMPSSYPTVAPKDMQRDKAAGTVQNPAMGYQDKQRDQDAQQPQQNFSQIQNQKLQGVVQTMQAIAEDYKKAMSTDPMKAPSFSAKLQAVNAMVKQLQTLLSQG